MAVGGRPSQGGDERGGAGRLLRGAPALRPPRAPKSCLGGARRADPTRCVPLYRYEMQLSAPEFRAYALEANARGDGIDIGLGMEIDGETGKAISPIPRMFRMV